MNDIKSILIGALVVVLAVLAIVFTGEDQAHVQLEWVTIGAVDSNSKLI